MPPHRHALCALGVTALLLVGCGSSGPTTSPRSIAKPSTPRVEECAFERQSRNVKSSVGSTTKTESPPKPGIYSYEMKGTQVVPGQGLRVKNLPNRSELIVTPARKSGSGSCFRAQTRISADLAITRTYVIEGENIFLVSVLTEAFGESQEVKPNPPVLSATSSGSKWSGQFGGPTYGAYRFSGLGKRTFRVDGENIRAVGIASSVTYRGSFRGSQVATTWIALRKKLVVAERLRSRQEFGATTLILHSTSRLTSVSGEPWTNRE